MAITEVGIRLSLQGQEQVNTGLNGAADGLNKIDQSAIDAAAGVAVLRDAIGKITAATASLDTVASAVGKLTTAMQSGQKASTDMAAAIAAMGGRFAGLETSIGGLSQKLADLGKNASGTSKFVEASSDVFGKMAASMAVANVATKALEVGLNQVGKVMEYLWDAAKSAARFETLGVVMQTVGRNAGYTGQQMMDASIGVQKLGITMMESRDSVTKMASAGIDLAKAQGLARIAQDAAVIGGINSSEALKSMVYGIQSAQVEVLRTIGINVSFEDSYKKLALQLGTTSESLSEQEKITARTNVVMEAGAKIAGAYEDAMGTAGKQLTSLARYSEDAKVKLGSVFNETLILAIATYTGALKDGNKELDDLTKNKSLENWSKDLANTFAFVTDAARNSFNVVAGSIDTFYTGMLQLSRFTVGDYQGIANAGAGWANRMGNRLDPSNQLQVQQDALNAKRIADAKTLTMPDKSVIVFETPEQKQAYQDGLAGIKKFVDDRQKLIDDAAEKTTTALKKNRTEKQKIDDEISRYTVAQVKAGIDINGTAQQEVIAAIRQHGKAIKAEKTATAEHLKIITDQETELLISANALRDQLAEKQYQSEQKQLDALHSNKLISEAQYNSQSMAIAQSAGATLAAQRESESAAVLASFQTDRDKINAEFEDFYAKLSAQKLPVKEFDLKFNAGMDTFDAALAKVNDAQTKYSQTQSANTEKTTAEWADKYTVAFDRIKRVAADTALEMQKFDESEASAAAKRIDRIALENALRTATPEQAAVITAEANARAGYNKQIEDTTKALTQEQKILANLAGMTDTEWTDVEIAKYGAVKNNVERLTAALDKLKGAQSSAGAQAGTDAGAKYAADEWKKTNDTISAGLMDALTKGGHEGAVSVRKLLENELVRKPFMMVVQAMIQPIANSLTNVVTGVSGMSGMSGVASSASSLSNITGLGTSMFSAGLEGTISTIAEQGFIGGFSNAMTSATTLASAGEFLGAVGAAVPYVGAALAVVSTLGSMFGSKGAPKTEAAYGLYTDNMPGDRSTTGMAGKYVKGIEDTWATLTGKLGIMTDKLVAGAQVGIDTVGDSLTQLRVFAQVNGQGVYSRQDRVGNIENVGKTDAELQAAMAAEVSYVMFAALKSSNITEQAKAYLQTVTDSLPAMVNEADKLAAVNTALSNVVVIHDFQTALESLPFEKLTGLSFDAAKGLIEAAGGLDKLSANLSGYYTNFYSDTEKQALAVQNIGKSFSDLGLVMPAVDEDLKKNYRTLIDGLMAAEKADPSAANARALAGAISLQGGVNSLADGFTNASNAAADAAQATADAAAKFAQAIATAVDSAQNLQVLLGTQTSFGLAQSAASNAYATFLAAVPGAAASTEAQIAAAAANPLNQNAATNQFGMTQAQIAAMNTFIQADTTWQTALQAHNGSTASAASATASTQPNTSAVDTAAKTAQDSLKGLADAGAKIAIEMQKAKGDIEGAAAAQRLLTIATYQGTAAEIAQQTAKLDQNTKDQKALDVQIEKNNLQDQLNTLTDTAAQALERQRNALDKSNQSLFDQIELEKKNAAAKTATAAYQEAMWTATGDAASLKIRERENTTQTKLAAGWTQAQIDNVYNAQDTATAKSALSEYTRAMLEAAGNTSGLAAFDKAVNDAALIAKGWTQAQINAVDAAKSAAIGTALTKDISTQTATAQATHGMTALQKSIWDVDQQTAAWIKTLTEGGRTMTATEAQTVKDYSTTTKGNLNADAAKSAADIMKGVNQEFADLGKTDLQKTLDGITQKGIDLKKSIADLGQTTPQTTAKIDALTAAQTANAQSAADAAAALAASEAQTQSVTDSVGFDAKGLGSMISSALKTSAEGAVKDSEAAMKAAAEGGTYTASAVSAANAFASALEVSVKDALISSTIGKVTETIYNSIITPIIMGSIVSQATIESSIAAAKAQVQGLADFMKTDGFKQLFSSLSEAVAPLLDGLSPLALESANAAASVGRLTAALSEFGADFKQRLNLTAYTGSAMTRQQVTSSMTPHSDPTKVPTTEQVDKAMWQDAARVIGQTYRYLATSAETVTNQIIASGTEMGKGLQKANVGNYLKTFGNDLLTLVDTLKNASDQAAVNAELARYATTAGMGGSAFTAGQADPAIMKTIGNAGVAVGQTIIDSLTATLPASIADSTLSDTVKASIGAAMKGVGQGDVQGLNDAFVLLSTYLASGKINAEQYNSALTTVETAFKDGAKTVGDVAAKLKEWQNKLAILLDPSGATERRIALETDLASTTDAATQAIIRQVHAIQNADAGVTAALSAVQRAIDAQKKTIQTEADAKVKALQDGITANQTAMDTATKSVDTLKGIFDNIAGAVKTLRGNVNAETNLLQARAYVDMTLSLAKAGSMPNADQATKLQDALGVITSDTAQMYASQADYSFAQLAQAGKLDELGTIIGVQKTIDEQQLKALTDGNKTAEDQIKAIQDESKKQIDALDAQWQTAQDQVNVLRGIDISVQSVGTAIAGLGTAIAAAQAATAAAAQAATASAIAAAQASSMAEAQSIAQASGSTGGSSWNISADSSGIAYGGGSRYSYAVGTNYVPYDQVANIHEGEMIVPKAYNPAAGAPQSNTARLEALVEKLIQTNQRLEARLAAIEGSSDRAANTLNDVTEGGSRMRTYAA